MGIACDGASLAHYGHGGESVAGAEYSKGRMGGSPGHRCDTWATQAPYCILLRAIDICNRRRRRLFGPRRGQGCDLEA